MERDNYVVVKLHDRRIAAAAHLAILADHAEVELLARDRDAPKGSGQALLQAVEGLALQLGRTEIRLEAVGEALTTKVYGAWGYEVCGPPYGDPAWPAPLFPMRKRLSSPR